jgi:hypothetical protein
VPLEDDLQKKGPLPDVRHSALRVFVVAPILVLNKLDLLTRHVPHGLVRSIFGHLTTYTGLHIALCNPILQRDYQRVRSSANGLLVLDLGPVSGS